MDCDPGGVGAVFVRHFYHVGGLAVVFWRGPCFAGQLVGSTDDNLDIHRDNGGHRSADSYGSTSCKF